jgi:hypothetical protein
LCSWTCVEEQSVLHMWFLLDHSNARYPSVTVRNVPLVAYSLAIG